MELNTKICLLVCAFAAAREFRPLEPFFNEFLTGPDIGFTEQQAVQEIYVIWSYSSFFLVIIVFLITDLSRYKPVIIADGVAGIMTYVLLLGKPSLRMIQVEQMFYSFFYSSETAYYTYMYAKIEDKTTYNRITGYVRACVLLGKFASGCASQLYVTLARAGTNSSKLPLAYMSIAGMSMATMVSLLFPPVKHTFYFHRREASNPCGSQDTIPHGVSTTQICFSPETKDQPESFSERHLNDPCNERTLNEERDRSVTLNVRYGYGACPLERRLNENIHERTDSTYAICDTSSGPNKVSVFKHLLADFKTSFSNKKVLVWAFWWSLAGAGSNLVMSYCQVIWTQVVDENYPGTESKNGVVDCIYTALSAAASYKVGQLNLDWTRHSDTLLTFGSLCIGVLVMLTSQLRNIYLLYLCYILFGLTYNTMLTVAEFEIAKQVKESCYGLVFGFIQFMTITFTLLWTIIVVGDTFFTFNIQRQFEFCAAYFGVIGVYYLLRSIQKSICGNGS